MKFKFTHLGPINDAEIDLADLTLVCGENNTGKTYITYAIYGFLRSWRGLLQMELSEQIDKIKQSTGTYHVDLNELFPNGVGKIIQKLADRYCGILPRVFATNDDFFKKTRIQITGNSTTDFNRHPYARTIQDGPAGKTIATLRKEAGTSVLNVFLAEDNFPRQRFSALSEFIADAIGDIAVSPHLPEAFIASAERTGAAIFRKQLDFARTGIIEALGTLDSKDLRNPWRLIESMEAKYAWPIEDNVNFVRQLEDIDKNTGQIAKQEPELLENFDQIIGGSYRVGRDKSLTFQPKGSGKPRLTMTESSSCVRALLDIGFYLRCMAKRGDLFIIDEPELNLHPKNQRALARLTARMVNAGVKIFITTHSDYFVKEINTLIMLAQGTAHTKKVQESHQYADTELLDPARIHLYMTCTRPEERTGKGPRKNISTLKQATISHEFGIEVPTFDDTIEEMNTIQNEIIYGGGF